MTNDNDARGALTEIAKAAWDEAWRLAFDDGLSAGHPLGRSRLDRETEWADSEVVARIAKLPAGDGLTDEQLDKFVADLVEYGTEFVAPLYAVVEQIERTALAAPRQPGEMGAWVQAQDALRWIMREAESAKEPCSDNPESPAAIRNGKLAGIATAAAQALGLVRGPSYAASAQQDEREAFEAWAVGTGLDVLRAAQWANTDYQSLPTEDAWRGWKARGQQVQADAGAVAIRPDHFELLRPFMSERDGSLTHSLTVYLREMADPEFAKRTHEARKRLYGAAAESDKRDAERYRMFRKRSDYWTKHGRQAVTLGMWEEDLDTAIDAAMSREQSGGDRG